MFLLVQRTDPEIADELTGPALSFCHAGVYRIQTLKPNQVAFRLSLFLLNPLQQTHGEAGILKQDEAVQAVQNKGIVFSVVLDQDRDTGFTHRVAKPAMKLELAYSCCFTEDRKRRHSPYAVLGYHLFQVTMQQRFHLHVRSLHRSHGCASISRNLALVQPPLWHVGLRLSSAL